MRHGEPDVRRAWPVHVGMKRPYRLLSSLSAGMNPRKKSKPNTEAPVDATSPRPELPPDASNTNTPSSTPSGSQVLQDAPSDNSVAASATSVDATTPTNSGTQTPRGKKWLSGTGSWRLKAPAIVRTATESIGVTGGATSELPGNEARKPRDESPKKFLTKRKSSKGEAIPAAITTVNVSSGGLMDEPEPPKPKDAEEPQTPKVDEPPLPPEPPKSQVDAAASTWGWRSWWSRPDGYADTGKAKVEAKSSVEEASTTPLPGPTPSEEPDAQTKSLDVGVVPPKSDLKADTETKDAPSESVPTQDVETKDATPKTSKHTARAASGSWFWSWSSAQNAQANAPPVEPPASGHSVPKPDAIPEAEQEVAPAPPAATSETAPAPEVAATAEPAASTDVTQANTTPMTSSKPSAWAFWYRGKPGEQKDPNEAGPQKHVGEVAVFNTPSQSHPEAAQFNEQEQPKADADVPKEPLPPPKEEAVAKKSFASLRGRPKAKTPAKGTPTDTPSSSQTATPTKTSPVLTPTKPDTASAAKPVPKQESKAKQEPASLVLPEFKNTYQMVQQPNFWQQLRRYFLGSERATPHLHINPAPPKIKKAVAIGVHGFFPAPILQKVLGQPTGTSIRFANAAAAAIKDWSEARGYTPEIEQIALEGEGFIAERVNSLWKLLLNWIDHIKQADFILVACHSQGVPVAMMLVAKLIQFGCVNATRIGVCAMAGVNMGPFIEYKTRYLGPTAAELFEFSNPKSLVSQMYLAALDEVLRFGVRILYVGSIDDQLVSLESSTFSTLSHPYIYRAVFVDGRIHAPDFVTHLVGFTLKLRNLGLPDHGLIRELSPALAGSLYGGEGHSRVYEDPAVYALAVQHTLETTSLPINPTGNKERPGTASSFKGIQIPIIGDMGLGKGGAGAAGSGKKEDLFKLRVKEYETNTSSTNPNPFFLPWAMRGLLEEEFVKKELGSEVEQLLELFEKWKPVGKQLKDVKFRLEGVRSKL
ncbi:CDC27 multi-domain protein [Pyrenophora tritici-repentis]|uniref:CDC27 multi-domain protein n=2 Tax=Pyrenophora tritici-repentis TaxID=45151 RepID=A0A922NHH5_9PLEO|nr:CDC27 multi-domain protein [Pyrenophora tritici-repentis]KAI0590321.1 CDC27 multi-domain protein [Pyrenophora tritici-repentis]KAI0613388.1 CDC27 multi-domain protein [Pyrenophora tritici-repentis]KAI0625385.1 CDC27 multi-domain protein [Pyrenophora tritici-repentis]KAI1516050.1 CDC27 multi-domain protein [Pyrenophora tritici-repentis]